MSANMLHKYAVNSFLCEADTDERNKHYRKFIIQFCISRSLQDKITFYSRRNIAMSTLGFGSFLSSEVRRVIV